MLARRSPLLLLACLTLACGDDGGTSETTVASSTATGSTGSSQTSATSSGSTSTVTETTETTDTGEVIDCTAEMDAESCDAVNEDGPVDGPRCRWLSLARVDGSCRINAAGEGCFLVSLDEGGPGCDPQFRTNGDMSVDFFSPADCALILDPGWESCGLGNDDPPAECGCFS